MINDPKPYGVGAGRLWLESHMSKLDPKIGGPYATQVVKEIDAYVERSILQARSQAFEECAKIAETCTYKTFMAWDCDGVEPVEANIPHREEIAQAIRQHSQKGIDT